jgi:ATP-dependent Zn protease
MHCAPPSSPFLSDPQARLQKACSDDTEREIDTEVKTILAEAYSDALKILRDRRGELERVARYLIKKETIDRSDFERLLSNAEKSDFPDEADSSQTEAFAAGCC